MDIGVDTALGGTIIKPDRRCSVSTS